jgi:hypothetical protein
MSSRTRLTHQSGQPGLFMDHRRIPLPRRGVFSWSIRSQFDPRSGWVPTRGRNRRLRPPARLAA